MEKLNCSVAKDLLPLYIDNALSDETAQILQSHIETCDSCHADYEILTAELQLPSSQNVQKENKKILINFRREWKMKKIAIVCTSVISTLIVVITCFMLYSHVGIVKDYFSPRTIVILRDIDTLGEWSQISFNGEDYLNFNSAFYKKKLVNNANSDDAIELRVRDANRNIVIDNLVVQPGEGVSLNTLYKHTDYIVEIKADTSFISLLFC